MLDEMFQWNALKFAILLEYKNPHSLFVFQIYYVDIEQGALIRRENKVAGNEKRKKNYVGYCIPKIWQILKHFTRTILRIWALLI